ncbi:MAG: hypothetical protein WCO82_10205, partial [Sphingomonadales bacterium]
LAETFPSLSGAQIVDILFRSADDLGDPGVDAIYGRGALNIARALAPIGGLTVPGTTGLVTLGGTLSAPLGDGGTAIGALAGVEAHDGYGRGYSVNLAGTLQQAAAGRLAPALLGQPLQTASITTPQGSVQLGWQGDLRGVWAGDRATGAALASSQAPVPLPTGQVRLALAGGAELAMGQGVGLAPLLGQADSAGLISGGLNALAMVPGASAALVQHSGGWHWGFGMASASLAATRGLGAAQSFSWQAQLGRAWGPLALTGLLAFTDENGSIAGARLSPGFGISGAATSALGLGWQLGQGPWALAGDMRVTRTQARLQGGLVSALSPLQGRALSVALLRGGAFTKGDRLALRLAQPWAVAGMVQWAGTDAPLRLGPSGRETVAELDYDLPLAGGFMGLTLFHRQQPGNIAAAPADQGGAVRLRLAW